MQLPRIPILLTIATLASRAPAQTPPAITPYRILQTSQLMGTGRIDYVSADSVNRRLYIPRGNAILVFDLDTLAPTASIPGLMSGHGVTVDPVLSHGFSSSSPVIMWEAKNLATIKTIPVQGHPDGILFESQTERVFIFSHIAPNVTVLDARDGTIIGTINLRGSPEQAVSDGFGHLYVDLEDKNSIAVVDVNALKVTAVYRLGGKGGDPGGLALDPKNHILFAFCRKSATAVILNALNGKILGTLPIGKGADGGGFNARTREAFSSQGDGTLTIIKENSPSSFAVEQIVQTMPHAKTCTFDTKTEHIILIATDRPASSSALASLMPGAAHGYAGPGMLHILVVGR